jgi:hypothetical protein
MKFEELNLLEVGRSIGLVGAIFSGNGEMHLCMFPESHCDVNDVESGDVVKIVQSDGSTVFAQTLNMNLDQWQQFMRQTDLMETEILAKDADGKIVKTIVRKCQRQIDQQVSWQVFKRDSYKCRYCGKDGVPLTVDHLVLWENGGPSTDQNMVSACKKCNKARGNMEYSEWLHHPIYRKASRGLSDAEKRANEALLPTLDAIPRNIHVRSR